MVVVWSRNPEAGIARGGISGPAFLDFRDRNAVFEDLVLFEPGTGTPTGFGEPEQFADVRATASFLDMFNVQIVHGRSFTPEEVARSRRNIAILSYGAWQRYFGRDPNAIGRRLNVDGLSYTVVGVMKPGFWFPVPCDAIVPWTDDWLRRLDRRARDFGVVGRLKPGVTLEAAQAHLRAVATQLGREHAVDQGWTASLVTAREAGTGAIRPALLGSVGLRRVWIASPGRRSTQATCNRPTTVWC
jgi:hypothetical protein